MIPELELDDIRIARQCRDVIEILGNDDRSASSLNLLDETAIARRLEQNKGLLHDLGQSRADRRVRLANPTAKMRRDVQDLHSAATAVNFRLAATRRTRHRDRDRPTHLELVEQRHADAHRCCPAGNG